MGLLPTYVENTGIWQGNTGKIPKEYGIDFQTGQLTGEIVEGKEAIKVWIWLALQTQRYRYYIYSWDYGSEFENLIGQGYTEEYVQTEVHRMVMDCLSVNKDIQGISGFSVIMENDSLQVSFVANTVYGKIDFADKLIKEL
jgi:hypothetical protein